MKQMFTLSRTALAALLIASAGLLAACDEDGPAEQVGEAIEDAVDSDGPLENAGEAIDESAEDAGEALDKAAD